ncbi:sensor histidine kinase [Yoonia maricola]|uniref:sensor histidine kinase n=1 Tax=Yoonia maricola TaxID=420999 RepID=UPI00145517EF|nr:sensor histidine kinase [Yoonia maricola]
MALLTLALLPISLVALYQTQRIAVEADRTVAASLLGLTERAARTEQLLIERAVGAARLFGTVAPDLLNNPEACAPNLSRFVDANPDYSFIGVLPLSGIVTCSSVAQELDFRDAPNFDAAMADQQATIILNEAAPASNQAVFVVSEPFTQNGEFTGFVSISIPHDNLPDISDRMQALGLVDLITFNENGRILTSRISFESAAQEIPRNIPLNDLSTAELRTFRTLNMQGIERRYSIVTIDGSPAAVMAVWEPRSDTGDTNTWLAVSFPVLMWLASMGVAMLAMNTLVIRHLTRMRRKMDAFADDRSMHHVYEPNPLAPIEIERLEENFARMSEEVLRDEAVMEDVVREKGVLVKEIHHRVKNNLQLISSIMNMQIRSAKADETKAVLRRVQDRVLSLATIHRDLYQSQDAGRVNVGNLVTEIVEKSTELIIGEGRKLDLQMQIDPVMLYPDQAVPLSLVVAEAATNAMKYIGDQSDKAGMFDVRLKQDGTACLLVMTNSVGPTQDQESTGLGSQLMNAFAMQLGGKIDIEKSPDRYSLTLHFNAAEFQPEARDY